jgi:uncharacterized protein (DUF1697 family)
MPRYAAFLRAVNLGRNRRVSGAELRALFEQMGFEDVASFRTSGNVVFAAGRESAAKLTARIEEELERALGHEARTYLRSPAEIEAIAAAEPFERSLVEASKGKLQVSLLAGKPSASARKKVEALATEEDRLAFGERELYWLPSGGYADAALDRKEIEKLLGPVTQRTKGTVEALAARSARRQPPSGSGRRAARASAPSPPERGPRWSAR